PSGILMTSTIAALKKEFRVNDIGEICWLLGMKVTMTTDRITLSQASYCDTILKRFGYENCRTVDTPMDCNEKFYAPDPADVIPHVNLYQQLIGSFQYLVKATRPDLAFSVNFLARF